MRRQASPLPELSDKRDRLTIPDSPSLILMREGVGGREKPAEKTC